MTTQGRRRRSGAMTATSSTLLPGNRSYDPPAAADVGNALKWNLLFFYNFLIKRIFFKLK